METRQTGEHFGNLLELPSPMNYHSTACPPFPAVAAGRTFGRVCGSGVFLFKRDEGKWHSRRRSDGEDQHCLRRGQGQGRDQGGVGAGRRVQWGGRGHGENLLYGKWAVEERFVSFTQVYNEGFAQPAQKLITRSAHQIWYIPESDYADLSSVGGTPCGAPQVTQFQ